ncbi:MAG: hypothetical protein WAN12_11465 [Candidatus Acidiferrum sp.]
MLDPYKSRGIALRIREYDEGDLEALRAIHAAQGFPYEFPDLRNPLFLTKLVLAGDETDTAEGKGIAGAALLRLTAEAYLLLDPKRGTPGERWQWLLGLHEATRRQAWERGLEDVHAWLPPEIAAKFGRRLMRLGWVRDFEWTPYCKRLK